MHKTCTKLILKRKANPKKSTIMPGITWTNKINGENSKSKAKWNKVKQSEEKWRKACFFTYFHFSSLFYWPFFPFVFLANSFFQYLAMDHGTKQKQSASRNNLTLPSITFSRHLFAHLWGLQMGQIQKNNFNGWKTRTKDSTKVPALIADPVLLMIFI